MRGAKGGMIAAAALACCLWACKPTEQSYRAAYEAAVAGRQAADSIGEAEGMQPMPGAAGAQAEIGGVRVPVVREFVAVTPEGGGINEYVKRYCVVAARFRQKFNALSMRERLAAGGYPGAFVVHTSKPEYFVVAGSASTPQQAAELVRRLQADGASGVQKGCPLLLTPAQFK